MEEPVETIMICAQQSLEIVGGLNPIQTEIEDDRVVNMLKKDKNVKYKWTLLGILFPASVKNNTELVFITWRELNDVKKALTNSKIYGLLGLTDWKKLIIGTN